MNSSSNHSDEENGSFLSFLHSGKRTWPFERRFIRWIFIWGISMFGCMFLLRNNLVVAPLNWVVALIPCAIALPALRAYYRFFVYADELVRKMQANSIGIGFAAGILFTIFRQMLEYLGVSSASANDVLVVMCLAMGFAQIYNAWKYR